MEHRDHARTASIINVIAGIWLIISPFVFNYASVTTPLWNNIFFGALIGAIGLIRASQPARSEWLSWANAIFGVWTILSSFFLNYPTLNSIWNNIIVGLIVAVVAWWSAMETHIVRPAHRS